MKNTKILIGIILTALLSLCSCHPASPSKVTDEPHVSVITDRAETTASPDSETLTSVTEPAEAKEDETTTPQSTSAYTDEVEYSYSFIREYLDSAAISEIFKNIKYNVSANSVINGVYEIKTSFAEGQSEWREAFSFEINNGHLFCPAATVTQIREIENYTQQRVHSVTFTDNSAEIVGDGTYNNVENYYVLYENQMYVSINGVIFSKDGKTLVLFPAHRSGHYEVPNGTESIDPLAFGKSSIESISFPKTLLNVNNSLENASSLESIYLNSDHPELNITCFSPYVNVTVVYAASENKLDHLAEICTVIRREQQVQGTFTEKDGNLYISEGTRSLLELDVETLSKNTYEKVVIPSSMSSLPKVYLLKTRKFEVAEENSSFYTENGIIYRNAKNAKLLVAYPALRSGGFEVSTHNIIIGASAFRGSSIKSFHSGLAQVMPHAFDDCALLEEFTTVDSQDIVIRFTDTAPENLAFRYDGKMKTKWPDFPSAILIVSKHADKLLYPDFSGAVFGQ